MKREHKLILGIFILALLIRVAFIFYAPVKIWDETVYANLGYDLSKNIFGYSLKNAGWSDFIPSSEPIYAWPNIGFRAPLLPYSLSILYLLKLNFLVNFFTSIIGALSVVLIYSLGEKLFNKKVGFYSAIFLMLLPLHTLNSGMMLTGVYSTFFVLLAFISFWEGYEKNNKTHKVLFGAFLALALLTRYTALWIIPIFLIYFLIRDKSPKFLKDKYLWYSILIFFIILTPWFIYGQNTYNNPIGAFIHGAKAASYWGGTQEWGFFFKYWWNMFSIIGFIFAASIFYIFYKKEIMKKEVYLLLVWFCFFLVLAIYMPHKEERFLLPIVPPICILSGFFISKIQKYKKATLTIVILILLASNMLQFALLYKKSYTESNICFSKANNFLSRINGDMLIITDESSAVYYYTKQPTRFYPNPWSLRALENSLENTAYENNTYVLFAGCEMSSCDERLVQIKKDLDENFEKVFECSKRKGSSAVYKYSS